MDRWLKTSELLYNTHKTGKMTHHVHNPHMCVQMFVNKYTYYLKWLQPMGQNFYLKSPKEQRAPLEYQEESGIEYWLYSQRAILLDVSIWKMERK